MVLTSIFCFGMLDHMILLAQRYKVVLMQSISQPTRTQLLEINRKLTKGFKIFSAITPGGVRIGTPAVTTRGMTEEHMGKIADYCVKAIVISKRAQERAGNKKLEDFMKFLAEDEEIPAIAAEVKAWAKQFPMPGQ